MALETLSQGDVEHESVLHKFVSFASRGVEKFVEVVGVGPAPDYVSDHYDNHDGNENPYKNPLNVTFGETDFRG